MPKSEGSASQQERPRVVEVKGPFRQSWQSLIAGAAEDESALAARRDAEAGFIDELRSITTAETLVVLTGLGTSLGITSRRSDGTFRGAPTMGDLWQEVSALSAFAEVRDALTESVVESENLEHILSDAQARSVLDPGDQPLQTFLAEAEAIVWQRCSFVDADSRLDTHELFLRKVARRSTRLQRTQLFSTNYDLAHETAGRRAHFNIIDGFGYGATTFDGASFDLDYVRRRPSEGLMLEPNVFHLLKMHGSVDWDSRGGEILKVHGEGRPQQAVLIYPSASKFQLSYEQTYLEFMSRFQIAMRQPDVGLIVVGFGFNDAHIVAPIESAVRSNAGLRMVVATPGLRFEERSDSLNWIEDLIDRGDRRLSLLNGTFDDLVRLLPEVPRTEERDAHNDRIAASRNSR